MSQSTDATRDRREKGLQIGGWLVLVAALAAIPMTGLVAETSSGVLASLVGAGGLAALTIRSERPGSADSSR